MTDEISRLRDSHHRVAQMFAMGMTPAMIRKNTGISMRRLALYYNNPAFQELIAQYSKDAKEKFAAIDDMYKELAMSNMVRAELWIADKLDECEDTGEAPPFQILDKLSQGRADRFGYGKNTTVRVEHDFAAMLERAIERSGKAKVIEGHAVNAPSLISAVVEATPAGVPTTPTLPAPSPNPPTAAARGPDFSKVLGLKRRRVA